MPAEFIPFNRTAFCELIYNSPSGVKENTLWFKYLAIGDLSEAILSDLGQGLALWWADNLVSVVSDEVTLARVEVTDMTSSISSSGLFVAGIDGENVANISPANVSMCTSFRTELRGRSFRGRNYFYGLTESGVNGDFVELSTASIILGAYLVLQDAIDAHVGGSTWQWVVASKFSEGLPRETGLTTPVTTVLQIDNIIDDMGKRLLGRGE